VAADGAVVSLKGISKSFGSVHAVRGVDFSVEMGRVEALLGENGAGKSTLIRIMTGIMQPDEGQIIVEGEEYRELAPRQAIELGIGAVAQELSLLPDLAVASNVLIGREPRNRLRLVDYRALNQRASELVSQLGIELDVERPVRELGFAQRQLVEVAKALALDPKVLILDEPTSGLRDAEVRQLFDVIRRLQEQDRSIVFISHRLDEVLEIADRITVLKDGERAGQLSRDEADSDKIVRLMVGREIEGRFPPKMSDEEREQLRKKEPLLEARGFTVPGTIVSNVNLSLWPGEVCGLAGLQGQGQTELLEGLFGVRSSDGELRMGEATGSLKDAAAAIKARVALVPEDRKSEGLILEFPIRENISLASLDRFSRMTIVDRKNEESVVREQIEALGIRPPRPGTVVNNLSGGNQQKVALAKWLTTSPRVLMLADPTRGVDIGTKQEMYKLVRNLASEGMAILYLSTELVELVELCDRILVMLDGDIVAELEGDEIGEEQIANASVGGEEAS
jgi:ABC-type sugar transport system ATPase subunit